MVIDFLYLLVQTESEEAEMATPASTACQAICRQHITLNTDFKICITVRYMRCGSCIWTQATEFVVHDLFTPLSPHCNLPAHDRPVHATCTNYLICTCTQSLHG